AGLEGQGRTMKRAYQILAYLVAAGVVLQAAFIAFGVFGLAHDLDAGAVVDSNYDGNAGWFLHAVNGAMAIPLLALGLLILSFFARVRGGIRWAGAVFGLVVLQVMLAYIAFGVAIVGVLHGINALALFAVAVIAGRRAAAGSPASSAPARTKAE